MEGSMIKAVKAFWQKAVDEKKQIKTIFTGEIIIRGNLGTSVFEGCKEKIRSPHDTNLIYNFKNQLKAKDLVSSENDTLVFNFSDMGTGAIYSLID